MTNHVPAPPTDPPNTQDKSNIWWIPKDQVIEESKDLTSLALDELIGNLKVHEVVMEKDSEIYRGKKERIKSIALKSKKESSDDETSTSGSDDEEYAMVVRNFKKFFSRKGKFVRQPRKKKKSFRPRMRRKGWSDRTMFLDAVMKSSILAIGEKEGKSDRKWFRCGDPNHLIGDCPKPPHNKDQKAFIEGVCLRTCLEPDEWIKDSGCSKHMTGNQSLFSTYKAYNGGNIVFGSNLKGKIIVKESLNVTFDESPPPTKLSPLVDDDVGEEEAIIKNTKVVNNNNEEDESIEVDEIVNIKESKNHLLDQLVLKAPFLPKLVKQKLARKNKLKAKSTLLLAIPGEHLLKFHGVKDAKTLWEAIKTRFHPVHQVQTLSQISVNNKTGIGFDSQMTENELHDIHKNNSEVFESASDSSVNEIKEENNQVNDRFKKVEGYHAVPPPYTGNYMPSRPDLSFAGLDDSVYKTNVSETITSVPRNESTASKSSKDNLEQPKDNKPSFKSNENTRKSVIEQNTYRQAKNLRKSQILTKSGNVLVNTAKQSSSRAAVSNSTARYVNTAASRPTMNGAKTCSNVFHKSHSSVKRTIYQRTVPKNSNFKEKVNTAKRPTGKVIDHISKDSGSYIPKRFDYVDPQGRLNGCSRHMTGNKSYLTDYQDIDGGFVAFIGSPKGGKNTGKGKIRTGKLDFKDLLDESQVLLKVPRQNNMYSYNLKNVVPSGGLTCLFAKATIDESNLCHRRLGHVNFKTMNKLMRGNLVRGLPLKLFENDHTCVACQKGKQHKAPVMTKHVISISHPLQMLHMDLFGPTFGKSLNKKMYCLVVTDDFSRCDNGTEFKNSEMNQFYEMKGIKREFSVARTPQQNGAEAINTACYVQNRVLITKPHNKTPYELLIGRSPNLDFMRPFGCLVTTLNTLDHLGKFEGKADEGFLVGYSVNVRNKARLVTQGYTQEEGINYDEVFAPVAKIEAIRLFLAYASFMGFIVYHMDVKSAFLYGTIEEEVYMCQPPGFEDLQFSDKVYKVEQALYGLHQAPRAWYETLSTYLIENGFRRGTIDKTLFIKKDKGDILLVQVYVDDIIFGSTKKSLCDEFEGLMHKRFQMSSMGELTFFLGLQVQQKKDGIFISQDKYVADILKKFDFATVKTASTPMEPNKALIKDEEAEAFQVTPKMSHLHAVKRIFRYLKGQPKLGLWYPRDSPFDLEAFSDSDYAGASLDRKSTTGGCQFLGKRLISWQCKKQTIVANSTTEAEYVAAANCCGQRASKGYTEVDIPLFSTMLAQGLVLITLRQETEVPQPSSPSQTHDADEATSTRVDVRLGGAATTVSSLDIG
ncbi:putative ribonuclease H-like domain-containing protein [Tanacetum coccineum]